MDSNSEPVRDAAFWQAQAEKWARRRGWREITPENPWPSVDEPKWTEGWTNGEESRDPRFPEFDESVDALLASLPDGWMFGLLALRHYELANRYAAKIFAHMSEYIHADTAAHALLLALDAEWEAVEQAGKAETEEMQK